MDLRRFAQTNAMSSPRQSSSSSNSSGPSTPVSKSAVPVTPKPRLSYPITRSPLETPSLSASLPFDWEAVRGRRDPPYSPIGAKRRGPRKSEAGVGANGVKGTPSKRIVRKKSFFQKITAFPSRVAFEISIFPANVPLPTPQTSACLIGGTMHFLHFCVRVSQIRKVPDSDIGWEDMYREDNNLSWFDWTVPMTFILFMTTALNTLFLFTHTKLYHLHSQPEPVSSPHARFVAAPANPPTLTARVRAHLWHAFVAFWRFLLGIGTSASSGGAERARRVQELEVWTPGEGELMLFCVYSPMHAFLWSMWNSSNWVMMSLVMLGVGAQIRATAKTYQALLKDRAIIAAEVMHEYDEKFVYPRVNPVRRDACVMTNEAEVVSD